MNAFSETGLLKNPKYFLQNDKQNFVCYRQNRVLKKDTSVIMNFSKYLKLRPCDDLYFSLDLNFSNI